MGDPTFRPLPGAAASFSAAGPGKDGRGGHLDLDDRVTLRGDFDVRSGAGQLSIRRDGSVN